MSRAYIGMGSNLDDPINQLEKALKNFEQSQECQLISQSQFYQSRAIGPIQNDFINACICIDTRLSPHALLDYLQSIEHQQGRQRLQHWGPRTLDLDLLFYDNISLQTERLSLPHPLIEQRLFVLMPLQDLSPPPKLASGKTLSLAISELQSSGQRCQVLCTSNTI